MGIDYQEEEEGERDREEARGEAGPWGDHFLYWFVGDIEISEGIQLQFLLLPVQGHTMEDS